MRVIILLIFACIYQNTVAKNIFKTDEKIKPAINFPDGNLNLFKGPFPAEHIKNVYKHTINPVVVNDKVHFIEDDWKLALKQAAAQNKYIFVDAYASWCGPCKMLKAQTFTDAKAAAFFNKNFINISIDMEKGMGPQLAQEWGLQAYPTLIVFNPKGTPVAGTVGFINANTLIKFGQDALAKKK